MNEVAELELPTQENFRTDLRTLCQGAIRVALEVVLEEEIRALVGAKKWERQAQRIDSRNGTYLRRLITSMGAIDLKVPRSREGGSAGVGVFDRYKRRSGEVDDTMVAAYVHGASTRDIGQITEALMGEHVSRSTVSRAAKTLGLKVEDLRKAPIEGPIPYLFLDATFLDARWAREVENVSPDFDEPGARKGTHPPGITRGCAVRARRGRVTRPPRRPGRRGSAAAQRS
jgi:transposase-like protein